MKKDTISFLIFGDVFGKLGRKVLVTHVRTLKKEYQPNLTIANIENATHGAGFSAATVDELMDAGVEFFTGGDHSLDNRHGKDVLNIPNIPVIRPLNFIGATGEGAKLVAVDGKKVLIVNLLGRLYMKKDFMHTEFSNPFLAIDTLLKSYESIAPDAVIVDMHAETTAEKGAMAYYLDGRASLVFGTHTHIPTADERILPNGTGFITDVGFNGPLESVIGINPQQAIHNFQHLGKGKTSIIESGPGCLNAIFVRIDTTTKRCVEIKRINQIIPEHTIHEA